MHMYTHHLDGVDYFIFHYHQYYYSLQQVKLHETFSLITVDVDDADDVTDNDDVSGK